MMARLYRCLAALLLGIALLATSHSFGQTPASSSEQIRTLAGQTDVVLRATVRVLRSATWSIQDVDRLAVARLEEVISGPKLYNTFLGRDITIHLRDPSKIREGEGRIFFVTPWFIGDTVGVIEVGSIAYEKKQ